MALITCEECGKEISDSVKKCPHCGYKLNAKDKKKRNKILIALGAVILVVVGAGACLFFSKGNETEKYVKLIEEGNVDEAKQLYDELKKKPELLDELTNSLKEEVDGIVSAYYKGEINFDDADAKLSTYSNSDLVKSEIISAKKEIEKLKESRNRYQEGLDYEAKKEYENAIIAFKKVIENDTNYSTAQDKINMYRSTIAENYKVEAEKAYKEKKYDEAISKITNAISYDDKSEYTVLKETYQQVQKKKEEAEKRLKKGDVLKAKDMKITFERAELTYKILPRDTSGYYTYYSADSGEVFFDMVFKIKNTGERDLYLSEIVSEMNVEYANKYNYDSFSVFYIEEDGSISNVYDWDTVEPLRTTTIHVSVDLPQKVTKNKKSIVSTLWIAGKEKKYVFR